MATGTAWGSGLGYDDPRPTEKGAGGRDGRRQVEKEKPLTLSDVPNGTTTTVLEPAAPAVTEWATVMFPLGKLTESYYRQIGDAIISIDWIDRAAHSLGGDRLAAPGANASANPPPKPPPLSRPNLSFSEWLEEELQRRRREARDPVLEEPASAPRYNGRLFEVAEHAVMDFCWDLCLQLHYYPSFYGDFWPGHPASPAKGSGASYSILADHVIKKVCKRAVEDARAAQDAMEQLSLRKSRFVWSDETQLARLEDYLERVIHQSESKQSIPMIQAPGASTSEPWGQPGTDDSSERASWQREQKKGSTAPTLPPTPPPNPPPLDPNQIAVDLFLHFLLSPSRLPYLHLGETRLYHRRHDPLLAILNNLTTTAIPAAKSSLDEVLRVSAAWVNAGMHHCRCHETEDEDDKHRGPWFIERMVRMAFLAIRRAQRKGLELRRLESGQLERIRRAASAMSGECDCNLVRDLLARWRRLEFLGAELEGAIVTSCGIVRGIRYADASWVRLWRDLSALSNGNMTLGEAVDRNASTRRPTPLRAREASEGENSGEAGRGAGPEEDKDPEVEKAYRYRHVLPGGVARLIKQLQLVQARYLGAVECSKSYVRYLDQSWVIEHSPTWFIRHVYEWMNIAPRGSVY